MIVLVELDRPYIADVAFGNGLREPILLEVGTFEQEFLKYQLTKLADRWHCANETYGPPGMDFTLQPRILTDFDKFNSHLQSSPESWFTQITLCNRMTPAGMLILRGAVLRTITGEGPKDRVIESLDDFQAVLVDLFGLTLTSEEMDFLWVVVRDRHSAWRPRLTTYSARRVRSIVLQFSCCGSAIA